MSEIDTTLGERENSYGDFFSQSRITQRLKHVMFDTPNWEHLSADKKEALEMIVLKIGRLLNGNPAHQDSWHDISGYARLVEQSLASIDCD